jgi:hypothetical protein
MARDVFHILKSLNEELLGHRWTDDDLQQLVTPRFGVVSSFANISRDLTGILAQDLGDMPPSVLVEETGK